MTDGVHIDPQTVLESMGKLILRLESDLAEADMLRNSVSDFYAAWQARCTLLRR